MLCAEALADALKADRSGDELSAYPALYETSWLAEELHQTRNFKLWFKKGPLVGQAMTGIEQWLMPKLGMAPLWTLHRDSPDHVYLKPAAECPYASGGAFNYPHLRAGLPNLNRA